MTTYDPGPVPPAPERTDPLDWITWVQYRAAFLIAVDALEKIAAGLTPSGQVAADALHKMADSVSRFDDSEPSWQPKGDGR